MMPALVLLTLLGLQDPTESCKSNLRMIWQRIQAQRQVKGTYPAATGLSFLRAEHLQGVRCPVSNRAYRGPSTDLNRREREAKDDPIAGDAFSRKLPHDGVHVLYRDGSIRLVRRGTPDWNAYLAGTTGWTTFDYSPGATWTWRTSDHPDAEFKTTCEEVALDGNVKLLALVTRDAAGTETRRELLYPVDDGVRFFKLTLAGKPIPIRTAAGTRSRIMDLIDLIESDDPFERQDAVESLAPLWFEGRDILEETIRRTREPETASKLRQALASGIVKSGPMRWAWPLFVGAEWETSMGEGLHFRHRVAAETFIVTALGDTHCYRIESTSDRQTIKTWFSEKAGPVVVQILEGDRRTEWRLTGYQAGSKPGQFRYFCPQCAREYKLRTARGRNCPTCGSNMIPLDRFGPNNPFD